MNGKRAIGLQRKELVARFGAGIVGALPDGIWARGSARSVSLEAAAQLAGFDSGDALRLALMQTRAAPESVALEAAVAQEMARRHGDIEAELPQRAALALANDVQAQALAAQAKAIAALVRKQAGGGAMVAVDAAAADAGKIEAGEVETAEIDATEIDATEIDATEIDAAAGAAGEVGGESGGESGGSAAAIDLTALRAQAAAFIARRKLRDLETGERYEANGARLAEKLEAALAAKDYARALELARQRLFNFLLLGEALAAGEKIDAALRELQALDEEGLTREAPAHWARIEALLARHGLRGGEEEESGAQSAGDLEAWLEEQRQRGAAPMVAVSVVLRADAVSWRELSFAELLELRDAIASIAHVARRGLVERRKEREAALAALRRLPLWIAGSEAEDGPTRWSAGLVDDATLAAKIASYVEALEGGAAFARLLRAIEASQAKLSRRRRQEGGVLAALLQRHYGRAADSVTQPASAVFVPELGVSLTLEERLCLALNWGSDSGRAAVLGEAGGRYGAAGVLAALATLEKRDWDFVQAVWDWLAGFQPALAASYEKRVGLALEKAQPAQIVTAFGAYRGGFYPLAFDAEGEGPDSAEAFAAMNNGDVAAAGGKAGQAQALAAAAGKPVMLSLAVAPHYVEQALTELELGEAINAAWALAQDEEMRTQIAARLGPAVAYQLARFIERAAIGPRLQSEALFALLRGLRSAPKDAACCWALAIALVERSGFSGALARAGGAAMLSGLALLAGDPTGVAQGVHALSPAMAQRRRAAQRRALAQGPLFWAQAKLRQWVELPLWLAAYAQALRAGETEAAAIAAGDAAVAECGHGAAKEEAAGEEAAGEARGDLARHWAAFAAELARGVDVATAADAAAMAREEFAADWLIAFFVQALLGEACLRAPGEDGRGLGGGLAWLGRRASAALAVQREVAACASMVRDEAPAATDEEAAEARRGFIMQGRTVQPLALTPAQLAAWRGEAVG